MIHWETSSIDCNAVVSIFGHGLSQPAGWVPWTSVLVCVEHIGLDHHWDDITHTNCHNMFVTSIVYSSWVLNPDWIVDLGTLALRCFDFIHVRSHNEINTLLSWELNVMCLRTQKAKSQESSLSFRTGGIDIPSKCLVLSWSLKTHGYILNSIICIIVSKYLYLLNNYFRVFCKSDHKVTRWIAWGIRHKQSWWWQSINQLTRTCGYLETEELHEVMIYSTWLIIIACLGHPSFLGGTETWELGQPMSSTSNGLRS